MGTRIPSDLSLDGHSSGQLCEFTPIVWYNLPPYRKTVHIQASSRKRGYCLRLVAQALGHYLLTQPLVSLVRVKL